MEHFSPTSPTWSSSPFSRQIQTLLLPLGPTPLPHQHEFWGPSCRGIPPSTPKFKRLLWNMFSAAWGRLCTTGSKTVRRHPQAEGSQPASISSYLDQFHLFAHISHFCILPNPTVSSQSSAPLTSLQPNSYPLPL